MTIAAVLEKVAITKKNKALLLKVRELDEDLKGRFIGFVDDEHASFDVAVTIKNNELQEHHCDCSLKDTLCIHQLAVLMHLSNQTNVTTNKRATKKTQKLTEAQLLLQELDLQELKAWLHPFFTVNKEVEIQFLLAFSKQNTSYELTDIPPLITTAFTSVIAKRKKIELNELKKIIQYLEQSLTPVFQYLQTISTYSKAFLLLEKMIETLEDKFYTYTVPGTRLQKYVKQLINQYSLLLNNTQDITLWQNAVNSLLHQLFEMNFGKVHSLLIETISSLNENGTKVQKAYIAAQIVQRLQEFIDEDFCFQIEINQKLLEILIENNKLEECQAYFTPYPHQNTFNLLLLNGLKKINVSETLVYCYELISYNTKVEYNIPYLKIIEELLENDPNSLNELAAIKHDLFSFEPTLERYKFVVNHLDDPSYLTKFKTNTLVRLQHKFDEDESYITLYLQILDYEGNYKKMIEAVQITPISFTILEPYITQLIALDKKAVFYSLANHIVSNLILNKSVAQEHEIRVFAQTYFTKQEVNLLVESFWQRFFNYYPERIRNDFFTFF
ncbi:hypothetical protein EG240_12360 [Paenimyroides tangerinum]|uniref:SWIM-type domain-containing protein n=1 Tax=Paenimyroides tangerinum TaxID=2488728 RepID=A0A3P3W2M8_9FLAO|nr:hypothetical protein [Paenimyroides tangerinum]RRJ89220.1 hypothetical protein EG240_12360 [Paenimyroides tangerinum]